MKTDFREVLFGDAMSTGKTLQAVRAIEVSRDDPGAFSVILCPKAILAQWKTKTESYYPPVRYQL